MASSREKEESSPVKTKERPRRQSGDFASGTVFEPGALGPAALAAFAAIQLNFDELACGIERCSGVIKGSVVSLQKRYITPNHCRWYHLHPPPRPSNSHHHHHSPPLQPQPFSPTLPASPPSAPPTNPRPDPKSRLPASAPPTQAPTHRQS